MSSAFFCNKKQQKIKVTFNENVRSTAYASGMRLPNRSELAKNRKNDNDITICRHKVIAKFFDLSCFSCQV